MRELYAVVKKALHRASERKKVWPPYRLDLDVEMVLYILQTHQQLLEKEMSIINLQNQATI